MPRATEELSEDKWCEAEEKRFREFDQWQNAGEGQTVLAINFGRRTVKPRSSTEYSHYVFLDALAGNSDEDDAQ